MSIPKKKRPRKQGDVSKSWKLRPGRRASLAALNRTKRLSRRMIGLVPGLND